MRPVILKKPKGKILWCSFQIYNHYKGGPNLKKFVGAVVVFRNSLICLSCKACDSTIAMHLSLFLLFGVISGLGSFFCGGGSAVLSDCKCLVRVCCGYGLRTCEILCFGDFGPLETCNPWPKQHLAEEVGFLVLARVPF